MLEINAHMKPVPLGKRGAKGEGSQARHEIIKRRGAELEVLSYHIHEHNEELGAMLISKRCYYTCRCSIGF